MSDLPGFQRETMNARGVVAGARETTEARLDKLEEEIIRLHEEMEELSKAVKKKKG